MIGIDIIDLSCSFSSQPYSLSNYKKRILQQPEHEFCHQWIDLECIWAIKESMYKCHYQITGMEFYNPKRILITHFDPTNGLFAGNIDDAYYQGQFEYSQLHVFAIASPAGSFSYSSIFITHHSIMLCEANELAYYFKEEAPQAVFQFHAKGFPHQISIRCQRFDYSRSHHGAYYISVITPTQHN